MLSLIERTAPKDAVHAADMAYAQAFTPTRAAPGHAPYTNAWARRDDVMLEVLHKAQRELPWDALRHCLRRRARHPEAWLAMRAAYAASLASSSAAGYLVGLGDRHLANLLVVEGTGAVVPIDFGYAFGTAVLVSDD
ncbi:kinase-like domain-containing protein [Scenedesmus sp. NREL 46B-D3]|nr:kinase-like domain-containing protein [Scenedesmus sp. NREL 46B-D3]